MLFEDELTRADITAYASTKFPEPREFQERAHNELRRRIMAGERAVVLMAATGAGKTYCALRLCNGSLERGRRATFMVDRETLIKQTSRVADAYGLTGHGIIQADNPRISPRLPLQIASAQTIARRGWPDGHRKPDIVIIDECHTQHTVWTEYVQKCLADPDDKTIFIGLSATPFTKGLGKLFSSVCNAATMAELVEQGVLTPLKVHSCKRIDMSEHSKGTSEWKPQQIEDEALKVVGDVVLEYRTHADGRKAICFASSQQHARELVTKFNDAGIPAAVFTSDTPDAERESALKSFQGQDSFLRVLVSVEALAKGFDQPDVSCVIDCRPLRKSLSTYIQMVGRGIRSSPGKEDCVLLDHTGNFARFLRDFERIYHDGLDTLDMGEKYDKSVRKDPEEKELKSCPSCGFKPFFVTCVSCGYERPKKDTVAHSSGRLHEAIMIGNKKVANDNRDLYAQLVGFQQEKGYNPGWVYHQYVKLTGVRPPSGWNPEKAIPAKAGPELRAKIRSLQKQSYLLKSKGYHVS